MNINKNSFALSGRLFTANLTQGTAHEEHIQAVTFWEVKQNPNNMRIFI